MSEAWGFETKQIHVGGEPDTTTGARAVPIYQSTSFVSTEPGEADQKSSATAIRQQFDILLPPELAGALAEIGVL